MKMLQIAEKNLEYKGQVILGALNKRGVKSFSIKKSAFTFNPVSTSFRQQNMIGMDARPDALTYASDTGSYPTDTYNTPLQDEQEFSIEFDADLDLEKLEIECEKEKAKEKAAEHMLRAQHLKNKNTTE